MIQFGTFELNNCILNKYSQAGYSYSRINQGKPSYSLFLKKEGQKEEEDFFVICTKTFIDLTRAERYKEPLHLKGNILKNPTSHKTLFFIDETGLIEFENKEE